MTKLFTQPNNCLIKSSKSSKNARTNYFVRAKSEFARAKK
jgi:hypothetical protein